MRAPLFATLYVTNYCQYACRHCFLTDQESLNVSHMSLSMVSHILAELERAKVFMLVISGGDPLLHPDIIEVLRRVQKHNMVPLIGANCVMYSKDLLEELTRMRITHLQVSIDLLREDAFFPNRSLSENLPALQYLIGNGMRVSVAISLHSKNFSEYEVLVDKLLRLDVERVRLSFWTPTKLGQAIGISELGDMDRTKICRWLIKKSQAEGRVFCSDIEIGEWGAVRWAGKHPMRLVIGPTGKLLADEQSLPYGSIGEGELIHQYSTEKTRRALETLNRLTLSRCHALGVSKIWQVPREQIGASGAVISDGDLSYIMIAGDLPPALGIFVTLHECGHIALNLLMPSRAPRCSTTESMVNSWVIDTLEPCISLSLFEELRLYALADLEDTLFSCIADKLLDNVIY